jgi:hypothetical protein
MCLNSKEIENQIYFRDLNEENSFFQKESLDQNISFIGTRDINVSYNENKLLGNKREKDIIRQFAKKDTKYRYDNLKRECKHLVIENMYEFY